MTFRLASALVTLLVGLGGCATHSVNPSPTSDQVIATQLRAHGSQGEMSGLEAAAIANAYRQQIARPSQKSPSPLSSLPDGGTNP